MIAKLTTQEQSRLASLGYDSVATPISVSVSSPQQTVILGNDTYILTGISLSKVDETDNATIVSLSSPTDNLHGSQRTLSMLGTSIARLFRNFIIIKTMGYEGFDASANVPQYRLDFIRISPKSKSKSNM